ncbi:uncharacterized protein BP01DRAFT_363733 [Aspergillus saccharolyticus JOP 1030-1]|uniref:Uncharacterized protein n=1 Tax=Aspergillus saccharolyticus JOP 1030-1 TaxID=1450539 RepID=A0A318ZM12_9EURO|nr:hypothetical protein BP01DRAFT_363733 [Aspergillus saccharolyticus JOP 1030-1]PYH47957.1 hypothetical protein BP01DRAFT_363733 [Aspergillus saccharolyticus JOP 1030-1]
MPPKRTTNALRKPPPPPPTPPTATAAPSSSKRASSRPYPKPKPTTPIPKSTPAGQPQIQPQPNPTSTTTQLNAITPTTTPTALLWAYELRRENVELSTRLAATESKLDALSGQLGEVREMVCRVGEESRKEIGEVRERVELVREMGNEAQVLREKDGHEVVMGLIEELKGRVDGLEGGLKGLVQENVASERRGGEQEVEEEVLVPDSVPGGLGGLSIGYGGGLSSTDSGDSTCTWETGRWGLGGGEGKKDEGCSDDCGAVLPVMGGSHGASKNREIRQDDADCAAERSSAGRSMAGLVLGKRAHAVDGTTLDMCRRKRHRRFIPIVPADEEDILIAKAMLIDHQIC